MDNFSDAATLHKSLQESSHEAAYLALRDERLSVDSPLGSVELTTLQTAMEKGFYTMTADIKGAKWTDAHILNQEGGGKSYQFSYTTDNYSATRTIIDETTYLRMNETDRSNFHRTKEIVDGAEFTFYTHDTRKDGRMLMTSDGQREVENYFLERSDVGKLLTPSKKGNQRKAEKRRNKDRGR